jgi:hypothetical protein
MTPIGWQISSKRLGRWHRIGMAQRMTAAHGFQTVSVVQVVQELS